MTHPHAMWALLVLLAAPAACNKQEPEPTADATTTAPSAAPTVVDNDPLADVPTEADYEEQADLAIDKNNFVDRLDELEKEIEASSPGQ